MRFSPFSETPFYREWAKTGIYDSSTSECGDSSTFEYRRDAAVTPEAQRNPRQRILAVLSAATDVVRLSNAVGPGANLQA